MAKMILALILSVLAAIVIGTVNPILGVIVSVASVAVIVIFGYLTSGVLMVSYLLGSLFVVFLGANQGAADKVMKQIALELVIIYGAGIIAHIAVIIAIL